jgi:PAS domain S-box-containing protein
MAKLQSSTEPPSDVERIAALEARNAELELELKQLEAALRQSEERFRATYEQAAVGIAHCIEGRFIRANQKFCDILGYTLKELQALTYIDITHPDDLAVELPYCQQLLAGEISDYSLEKRYIRKDGSAIWINLTTSLVREPSGEIKYATALIEDISDRKRIEEALRQSEERFSKAFRVNPAATTITTLAEGRYIDVNDSFLRLSGFKREEVIGKTSVELGMWVAERSQVIPQLIQQLQHQPIYDLEVKFRNKSGEIRDGITSAELIDLSGELCLLGQLYDVTDRKRTEAALNYRLDFEALLTTISTQFINLKATEIDQAINQALQQIGEFAQVDRVCIFLISNERFFNTHQWYADGIAPLVYPTQGLALAEISSTVEQLRQFKTIHIQHLEDLPEPRKSIAQSFGVQSYMAVPIAYEGCLIGSLAFNSILTSKTWSTEDTALLRALANIFASALMRKRSEEALRESEQRFRQLAENVDAVLWVYSIDERKPLYVCPAYEKIWGHSVQSFFEGGFQAWLDTIHPDNQAQVLAYKEQQARGEQVECIYRIIKPDGSIRWIRDRAFPVHDTQGRFYRVAGVAEDITDRKLAEDALRESQAKLQAILDSASAVICRFRVFTNLDWQYEFFSSATQMLYGYTPQEVIADKNLWISRVLPEDLENVILPRYEDIFAERTAKLEYRFRHKDGTLRWFSMTLLSQRDETANCWVVTTVDTDITERKQAEEQLEASLQEKEALLKEVHHRVKNNLQVICSLLDLQLQRIQDPQVLEVFRNSQNRVRSMALIHEKLYQSESLSKVNLADYIESLTMYLIQTYAINPNKITLQLNLEPVLLNLDTAIPCGLILNELISNALKHAFPGNTDGTIWISLSCLRPVMPSQRCDVFELVVGNNGVKLPELPDFSRAKSLGFQLVNILTQQLNGQIEVSQNQGTEFKLRFE